MELDEVDIKILEILSKNCRIGLSDIARRLNKSVSTISYKLNKLMGLGIIKKCVALMDAKALGYAYPAIIMMRVAPGKLQELENLFKKKKEIQLVFVVTGDFDLMVYGVFEDEEHYFKFINEVHESGLVLETTTFNIVKKLKIDISLV